MSDKPPFDVIRAAFLLVACVIGAEVLAALIGFVHCVVWWQEIMDARLKCDPDNRLMDLMSSALSAALGFAAGFISGHRPKE